MFLFQSLLTGVHLCPERLQLGGLGVKLPLPLRLLGGPLLFALGQCLLLGVDFSLSNGKLPELISQFLTIGFPAGLFVFQCLLTEIHLRPERLQLRSPGVKLLAAFGLLGLPLGFPLGQGLLLGAQFRKLEAQRIGLPPTLIFGLNGQRVELIGLDDFEFDAADAEPIPRLEGRGVESPAVQTSVRRPAPNDGPTVAAENQAMQRPHIAGAEP
jgi:hypothetical protein